MKDDLIRQTANEDFSRARAKEFRHRLFSLFSPEQTKLLQLDEVKSIVKPLAEIYQGVQVVPIHKIIGSEGRFQDFNKIFLPKKHYLRSRWTSLDQAFLKQVILPPVHLYEIGGIYFVRDGNHRVSVARQMGQQEIDAVIISLRTELQLDVTTTIAKLRSQVIKLEEKAFHNATGFSEIFPDYQLHFTNVGRYQVITERLKMHEQWMITQISQENFTFRSVITDWFGNVFFKIVEIIRDESLLVLFPKKTEADVALWIIEHRSLLVENHQVEPSVADTVASYLLTFRKKISRTLFRTLVSFTRKSLLFLKRLFKRN